MGAQLTEDELIRLGRTGSTAALGRLFELHYDNSLGVAKRILFSPAEAEDAVQTAYCAAFQHFHMFRGESSFRTWITRIVVNRSLMAIRAPWRRRTVSQSHYPELGASSAFTAQGPTPEKSAWCKELATAHTRALAKLPGTLQAAYTLYALSDMSIADVATALRLKPAAAKSRIFRARAAMQSQLQGVWREEAREKQIVWPRKSPSLPVHPPLQHRHAADRATAV